MPYFQFIYELKGTEKILYSIDYPYQSLDGAQAFIHNLPISNQEKELIAHGNTEKLLKLAV
ncbi:amidohydrolase family protein [Avibacterium sp. 20-126]|nr:amidohydrolase family protein [Avibacterium sp. 20-126]